MSNWVKSGPMFVANCECGAVIKSKSYYLKSHSGKCITCSHRKAPFEHLFNKVKNTAKHEKHAFELTFQDFLNFTKVVNCHYCDELIDWKPFCYEGGKYRSGSYFLDRKDNSLGYSVDNCVVCCTRCNISKGNRFSYDEWKEMTSCLKLKRKSITTPEST